MPGRKKKIISSTKKSPIKRIKRVMSNGMTAREHVEAIHICKDEYHEVLEKRVLARKNPT